MSCPRITRALGTSTPSACTAEAASVSASSRWCGARSQVDVRAAAGRLNFERRRLHSIGAASSLRRVRRSCHTLPRPALAPQGDDICVCGVSCLSPTPSATWSRELDNTSEASALLSLCPCSVCAHPYCPTRGSWRRRPSPAAARASCSSLSILLLLKPRPKTADTGRQRVAL